MKAIIYTEYGPPNVLRLQEVAKPAPPGAGQTALQCLKKGNIQLGQNTLIYGASGAVGTYAVQLASRHLGADVTGVCSGTNNEYDQIKSPWDK